MRFSYFALAVAIGMVASFSQAQEVSENEMNSEEASGFVMDVSAFEVRDAVGDVLIKDMAVGDQTDLYSWNFCKVENEVHVFGSVPIAEVSKSEYGPKITGTMVDGGLEITFKKGLSESASDFATSFAVMASCDYRAEVQGFETKDAFPIKVISIEGHSSSSEVLAALATSAIADVEGPGEVSPDSVWEITEEKDEITDESNVTGILMSSKPYVTSFGTEQDMALIIRCQRNTTSLYFHLNNYEINDSLTATYRIDGVDPKNRSLDKSSNSQAAGLWNGGKSIPMIKELVGKEKLLVRIRGRSDIYEMEFDLIGINGLVDKVSTACNWS